MVQKSVVLLLLPTILILAACAPYHAFPSQCSGASAPPNSAAEESSLGAGNRTAPGAAGNNGVGIELAFPNLRFLELTNLAQPNDGSDRIFVTEHSGCIYVFPNDPQVTQTTTFLNLTEKVRVRDEDGFMGLAFDPAFRTNGYLYVFYVADKHRRAVVSRFKVSKHDHNQADPRSERVILEIPLPEFRNHNGGKLAFGSDGYLYISVGEGGLRGKLGNSQNNANLLGTILRIDVRGMSHPGDYRIPPDNPFLGIEKARDEIWAYGFRNVWGMDFDNETGILWVTDTGRAESEEVNVVERGSNYGWPIVEGTHCFEPDNPDSPAERCDRTGLVPPLLKYGHNQGCAIIGGYVYRGGGIPSLEGAYVYGDYCSGKIWGLWYDGQSIVRHSLLAESRLVITTFGEDVAGNIYVLDAGGIFHLGGNLYLSTRKASIYRLVASQ